MWASHVVRAGAAHLSDEWGDLALSDEWGASPLSD